MERDSTLALYHAKVGISTHTLTWSVTLRAISDAVSVDFNSHAHVERDSDKFPELLHLLDFNSHAHVERDQVIRSLWKIK